MSHVPRTNIHRYVGEKFMLKVTVKGLTPGQVTVANWKAVKKSGVASVTKTLGTGITAGGIEEAILSVDITKADTESLGQGVHDWQADAGGPDPPIVAVGTLELSARL